MEKTVNYNGYEISQYRPHLMSQVVNVLRYLWGDDHNRNLSYFRWKYDENPYTEHPLGIVALHKGKVIGFRGYFATRWQIYEKKDTIIVLCPGDTCVHPDHRRKRLSLAMGNMAMYEYASKYRVFLNLSAGKNSVPGYLRMGFIPLFDKVYMTRCNLFALVRFILTANKSTKSYGGKIAFGDFGDIEVRDCPRPEEMHAVISRQEYKDQRIILYQDEEFFSWRYNNKMYKYVFYYCRQDNITTGYIVLRITKNARRAYIVDYAANDSKTLRKMLKFIIKMKHFDILSIYHFSLEGNFVQIFNNLHFKTNGLIQIIERKSRGEWPLLVRPVKRNYAESDCFIEELDIRRIENWAIKAICSDGG